MPEDHPLPASHSPETSMPEEQPTPTNETTSPGKADAGTAESPSSGTPQVDAGTTPPAEAPSPTTEKTPQEPSRPMDQGRSNSPQQSSQASPSAPQPPRGGEANEPPRTTPSRPTNRPKPELVVKKSGKLALPQSLKRTSSVAKVAGSKLLRDAGEGLVGFSEWLEGNTNEQDVAEATAVQENLEERFEGTWQKWGGFLDQLKAPLPKKFRRISNARITGLLVGILVFLFLALSSAISGPSSQAKDADTPITRQSQRPANSKLVKSRTSETKPNPSPGAPPQKASQSGTSTNASGPTGKKSVSAATIFGEEAPRKAPPLNRPASPRSTSPKSNPAPPATPSAPPTANPPASPYPYGGYGVPGYPPPGYGQPSTGTAEAGAAAPNPGAYPPPYPYPPYFYPPPGYPGSAESSAPAVPPGQPVSEGQPSPYGGYAPYPYPYPYPPQAAVTAPPAEFKPLSTATAPGKTRLGENPQAPTTQSAIAPAATTTSPPLPASPSDSPGSLQSDRPAKK